MTDGVSQTVAQEYFYTDLLPVTDGIYNLGSAALEWAGLYWGDGTRKGRLFANAGTNSLAIGSISAHNVEFRYNNVAQMVLTNGILEPNSSASCSLGDTAGNQWTQCTVGNGTIKGNFSFSVGNSSVTLGSFSNHTVEFRVNNAAELNLTSASLSPAAAAGSDLGSSAGTQFGSAFVGDGTTIGKLTTVSTTVRAGSHSNHKFGLISNNTLQWSIDISGNLLQENSGQINFPSSLSILANTADGSDSATLNLGGGGASFDDTRGSFIVLKGNEAGANPGDLILGAGNVTGGDIRIYCAGAEKWQITKASSGNLIPVTGGAVSIGSSSLPINELYFGSTSNTGVLSVSGGNSSAIVGTVGASALEFRTNNTRRWNIDSGGILQNNVSGNESTGAGTALLGSNSPAVTNTAPYTWIKLKSSDGSTVYIPVWK